DGDDWAAAVWPLVHRVDRDEHRWIADRGRRDAADRGLGVAVMVDVGIVEHDLAPAAQLRAMVGLGLDEAVHEAAPEVVRARSVRSTRPSSRAPRRPRSGPGAWRSPPSRW